MSEQPRRLLLVEDDAPLREALGEAIALHGFQVPCDKERDEACQAVDTQRFDVVLSDVRLPGGGGATVLERVRRLEPRPPVIMMTGFDEPGGRDRALGGGAAAYLLKPIALPLLIEVLRRALPEHE